MKTKMEAQHIPPKTQPDDVQLITKTQLSIPKHSVQPRWQYCDQWITFEQSWVHVSLVCSTVPMVNGLYLNS